MRADQPSNEGEPLIRNYGGGVRPKNRHTPITISEENMEAVAQAMNQWIQTRGVKSKSPLPSVTITN